MQCKGPGVPEPIAALNRIRLEENGEPLVDLRGISPKLVLCPDPLLHPYLRARVAKMLCQAAADLPSGYHLYLNSALRSMPEQEEIWNQQYLGYKNQHRHWPESILRRTVNRFVAPYDQLAPPGHCTGGALDVVLQKEDGSFVDLPEAELTDWTLARTWSDRVSPEISQARMILLKAMLGAGFSNCRDEYWHYSYGDAAWAVRMGKQVCCYGVVEVPE